MPTSHNPIATSRPTKPTPKPARIAPTVDPTPPPNPNPKSMRMRIPIPPTRKNRKTRMMPRRIRTPPSAIRDHAAHRQQHQAATSRSHTHRRDPTRSPLPARPPHQPPRLPGPNTPSLIPTAPKPAKAADPAAAPQELRPRRCQLSNRPRPIQPPTRTTRPPRLRPIPHPASFSISPKPPQTSSNSSNPPTTTPKRPPTANRSSRR